MTFEEWAIKYFGKGVDFPEACRDAWNAAAMAEREVCASEIESMAGGVHELDTDGDALLGAADMLRSNASLTGAEPAGGASELKR